MQVKDLLEVLEREYPNDVMALKEKNDVEIQVYLAQVEMIEFIKSIEKGIVDGR